MLATREASKANNIKSNEKCYVSRYITILIFINLNLENFDAETITRMQMICEIKKIFNWHNIKWIEQWSKKPSIKNWPHKWHKNTENLVFETKGPEVMKKWA